VISNSLSAVLQLNWNLVAFGVLLIFSLIEMSITAWIKPKYERLSTDTNTYPNADYSYLLVLINGLLGMSIWTILVGALYWVNFLLNPYNYCVGVGSHLFLYALSRSIHHYTFSFEMFPIASPSQGLYGR
jgi:hypothetical protein